MTGKTKKILLWILDLAINLVIILVLVLVIQKWIIAPFDVSGASMCDTLNFIDGKCSGGYGEKIIINEAGYIFDEPKRGDIVVFKVKNDTGSSEEDKYFIKRVIGLPGDKIEIKSDGEVWITKNGTKKNIKIDEPYLNSENKGNTIVPPETNISIFKVPDDHYFVLGDNRQSSTDSRRCFQSSISLGCKDHPEKAYIAKESIRGKAWIVWWPLKNIRILQHPEYPELR